MRNIMYNCEHFFNFKEFWDCLLSSCSIYATRTVWATLTFKPNNFLH